MTRRRNAHHLVDAAERLAAIVDSSFDAIVGKDLDSIITDWNQAATRLFGYTADETIGQSVLMLIPESRHAEETDIIDRIRRGERVETFETVRRCKDGSLIDVSLTISPIRDVEGKIVGASKIARDISVAKENERRIQELLREVNHRVKNQFAVIVSMVRETAKRTTDPVEFERQIRDRIEALSKSHDLLVASDWKEARLFDLVQEHLMPFGPDDQVKLSGPLLHLVPNAVQYLGIALHELGTNSAKYGALSEDEGKLAIFWAVEVSASGSRELHLTWDESSDRIVERTEADRRGFGTVVLQRITPLALSGTAEIERIAGRFQWKLKAPLKFVTEKEPFATDTGATP